MYDVHLQGEGHSSQGLPQAFPTVLQHSDFNMDCFTLASHSPSRITIQHGPFRLSEKKGKSLQFA